MVMVRNGRMSPTEGRVFRHVGGAVTPKCEACGAEMVPASVTEWVCVHETCPEKDKPKNTGFFPNQ